MELTKGRFYRGTDGGIFADHIFMALEDGEEHAWCSAIVVRNPYGAGDAVGIKTLIHSGSMVETKFNPREVVTKPKRGDMVYRTGGDDTLFMVSKAYVDVPHPGACKIDLVTLSGYAIGTEVNDVHFFDYTIH